jgi:hypothetical protein
MHRNKQNRRTIKIDDNKKIEEDKKDALLLDIIANKLIAPSVRGELVEPHTSLCPSTGSGRTGTRYSR